MPRRDYLLFGAFAMPARSRTFEKAGALAMLAALATWSTSAAGTERPEADPLAPFVGVWDYLDRPSDRQSWSQGIERAVGALHPFIRGLARERMREELAPERRVSIASPGPRRVRIELGGWSTPVMPTTGEGRQARGPDGASSALSVWLGEGRLTLRSATAQGTRESFFSVAPDGRYLFMQVRVTSARLGESIRYTLTYRRHP